MSFCKFCSASFEDPYLHRQHQRMCKVRKCRVCKLLFNDVDALNAHKESHGKYQCDACKEIFINVATFKKHKCEVQEMTVDEESLPNQKMIYCNICDKDISRVYFTSHLRKREHIEKAAESMDDRCSIYKSALQNQLVVYIIKPRQDEEDEVLMDAKSFMETAQHCFEALITQEIASKTSLKFRLKLIGLYLNYENDDKTNERTEVQDLKSFYSNYRLLTLGDNYVEEFKTACDEVEATIDEFAEMASGWSILEFISLEIDVCKVDKLASSVGSFIKTPSCLKNVLDTIVNVKNYKDDKCFLYSVLAIFYHSRINRSKRDVVSSYLPFMNKFNISGIDFPVTLREVKIFEKMNSDKDISIHVYGLEGREVVGPYYFSQKVRANHINLLLIEKNMKTHFIGISNLTKLVGGQITKNNNKVFCNLCLSGFKSKDSLSFHHKIGCEQINICMPSIQKPYIEFNKFEAKVKHPFVFYGDIEAILERYHSAEPSLEKSFTRALQRHTPCLIGYNIRTIVDDECFKEIRLFSGRECMNEFVDKIIEDLTIIYPYLFNTAPMREMTLEEREVYMSAKNCFVCEKDFEPGDEIVNDHDHITSEPRYRLHSRCNLALKAPRFIPFFFHAAGHYDFHHLLTVFANRSVGEITVLPKTKEHYISFSVSFQIVPQAPKITLRFLDSYRFLSASLKTLTETVKDFPTYKGFHETMFPNSTFWKKVDKQFLPYSYFDSFERFEETDFPDREAFRNDFTDKEISVEDYDHALEVYNNIPNRNLGDYYKYYLTVDIMLLCDIFEFFRETLFKDFRLDPVFMFGTAGFSFNAMLLHIKDKIHLTTDQNLLMLVKKQIRGGISCSMVRYAKSNNIYVEGYDPTKESLINAYVDCNGLYSFCMTSFPHPYNDFKFLEGNMFDLVSKNFKDIPKNSKYGYLFLVDLTYPQECHEKHNDLPFCVESMKVNKVRKLVPNLFDKKEYLCHFLILQQALQHGLILTKIHKIIQFSQTYWLSEYINLCADKRKNINNTEFQKQNFKNISNTIFGKCIERGDLSREVKITNKWKAPRKSTCAKRLLASPRFHSFSIFANDHVAIEMKRRRITYNKPTLVGFTILETSKYHMYDFVYRVLKQKIGYSNLTVGYIDTDGIIILVKQVDFYQFIKEHSEYFDTSDFKPNNPFGIKQLNRKIPGVFKDEGKGSPIIDFITLRPKSYAIQFVGGKLIIKTKSVEKAAKEKFTMGNFIQVWKDNKSLYAKMVRIASKNHVLETVSMNKKCLSTGDDKRFLRPCNNLTYALGHHAIQALGGLAQRGIVIDLN